MMVSKPQPVASKKSLATNLVWLDLEMTGLDPQRERIIEIATIVTDCYLNVLAEGPSFAIRQPNQLLHSMDSWNKEQHAKSGLLARVRQSVMTEERAEQLTLDFLKKFILKGRSPLCGNSICQDRRFLYRYMPKLSAFLHYRNVDVSSIKILAKCWGKGLEKKITKEPPAHLALQDIRDSIEELRYYRNHFFKLDFSDHHESS